MQRITRNAIRCKHCGEVIESFHVHDYLRRCCKTSPEEDYEDLSESEAIPDTK